MSTLSYPATLGSPFLRFCFPAKLQKRLCFWGIQNGYPGKTFSAWLNQLANMEWPSETTTDAHTSHGHLEKPITLAQIRSAITKFAAIKHDLTVIMCPSSTEELVFVYVCVFQRETESKNFMETPSFPARGSVMSPSFSSAVPVRDVLQDMKISAVLCCAVLTWCVCWQQILKAHGC